MPTVAVKIPQIGEGLQEARLVAVLKQPGEKVKRDEPIYQMETDKAVMDVESPFEGVLVEWLASPDDILAIGADVARMEVAGAAEDAPAASQPRALNIPPRTRAFAKEKGLSDGELNKLAANSSKLMPADIEAYLASKTGKPASGRFEDRPVPSKQRVLNSRLVRASQLVVPGAISVAVNWEPIEAERAKLKEKGDEFQPSSFTMFAYAVAQAVKEFPSLRTSLIGEETFRTYNSLSLGIAVSLPGDELVLAVVEEADAIGWHEFAQRARDRIKLARDGKDQANEAVTLSLTNMQNFGLRDAVPVVVPPAAATLFIGEVYASLIDEDTLLKSRRTCNLALTFDHRVLNGVGAANFIQAVKKNVETISALLK